MTKVSTRPQAGANPPAAAPVLEPELATQAPLVLTADEQTVARQLLDLIEQALEAKELETSATALLRIASGMLEAPAPGQKPADLFCQVSALIDGILALDEQDKLASAATTDALNKANQLVLSTIVSYDDQLNGAVACADGIRAAQAVAAPARGLNAAQLTTVLQTIASYAKTMHDTMVLLQAGDLRGQDETIALDTGELLARTIGALADDASGGDIVGNANRWFHGATFANAGKAGKAGKAGAA